MDMSCTYGQYPHSTFGKPTASPSSLFTAQFLAVPRNSGICVTNIKFSPRILAPRAALDSKDFNTDVELGSDTSASTSNSSRGGILNGKAAKRSGTTARERRLLRVREEKRKRQYDHLRNYPAWAKVLEDALLKKEFNRKGEIFKSPKTGSVLAFKVSFRDFNPLDSYIWFELYGSPSDRDVDLLGSVIQSWYVMGRLGAFNSSNLQLASSSMEYNPLYDADKGFKVMPSSFHDISDVEFQDNWGRIWVDLGTC
ncbi:Protein of unknown function (DUF3531) [Abeliophyllum distichum]|uniref:Uncharacterized protein n=1 Tax=Abeliophyllum distichum TaxID=126358 RepID=A0ABD1RBE2_9LAMI